MRRVKRAHRHSLFVAAILVLVVAASARGHDTWVLPSRPHVAPGSTTTFDLTSGMAFPKNEAAVKPDRLARASFKLRGKESELTELSARKTSLRLKGRFPEPGIATLWIESKPRSLELSAKQVREYLDEIGAWDTIGKQWEAQGSGRWRESYTKHAKTFIAVGESDNDRSWAEPMGMALELIPEKDPTRLRKGENLTVRLLRDGKPVSGLAVGLLGAGERTGTLRTTDVQGRVEFAFPRSGWWLLRATQLGRSSKPETDWESHFTTLTLFAQGEGRN
jgi:uncharacterized GH25 family protein